MELNYKGYIISQDPRNWIVTIIRLDIELLKCKCKRELNPVELCEFVDAYIKLRGGQI